MEYLGLGLENMLCIESYVLYQSLEPDFMFIATGPGSILGPKFFLKRSIQANFLLLK